MKLYTECDSCGKQGEVTRAHDTMYLIKPAGWSEVLGQTMCGDCSGSVDAYLKELRQINSLRGPNDKR